jgi:hypothetical protein
VAADGIILPDTTTTVSSSPVWSSLIPGKLPQLPIGRATQLKLLGKVRTSWPKAWIKREAELHLPVCFVSASIRFVSRGTCPWVLSGTQCRTVTIKLMGVSYHE